MDRREALKKMAVGGATVVGASVVLTNTAFSDSGTVRCRFTFGVNASFTATLTRPANGQARGQVTVTPPTGGSCGCGGAPTFSYAFSVTLTDNTSVTVNSGGGATATWQSSATFDTGIQSNGSGNSAYSYVVRVGVRVQCPGISGSTFVCRFGTVSGSNAPTTTAPTALASSTPPAPLPSC